MAWKKALRIIHVSDIHMSYAAAWVRRRASELILRNLQPHAVRRKILRGVSGHDGAAFAWFRRSARLALQNDDDWASTQLVVTGDLTTWGDSATTSRAVRLWGDLASQLGLPPPLILYGNHDVWPDGFPLWQTAQTLDAHRSSLRSSPPFAQNWPVNHAVIPTSSGQRLSIWSLNTILHGQIDNFLALGQVREDRYWEGNANHPPQLVALDAAARAGAQEIRIILTHHPVAGGPWWWSPYMALTNAPSVASALSGDDPQNARWPLAFAVLSGHTHTTFPTSGNLAGTYHPAQSLPTPLVRRRSHQPLLQLTVGSVSQTRYETSPRPPPITEAERQGWQMLGFYLDDAIPRMAVERELFSRDARNLGPFESRGQVELVSVDL